MSDHPRDRSWTPPIGPYWAETRRATLIFDTLTEPSPPGFRGTTTAGRHLLYEAAPYTIDLHVELAGPERILMAGQIIEAGRSTPWVNEARVTVASATVQLGSANVSQLGEFHCQFDRHDHLSVMVAPRNSQPILISLKVVSRNRSSR